MGRHAGWLTAASALARKEAGDNPLLIYLPEAPFELAQFNDDLKKAFKKTPNVIVCVSGASATTAVVLSANIQPKPGRHLRSQNVSRMRQNSGKLCPQPIRRQVRSVELNVNQRCSGLTVSGTDLNEAEMAGRFGVRQPWTVTLDRWSHLSVRLIQLLLNLFMQLLPFKRCGLRRSIRFMRKAS